MQRVCLGKGKREKKNQKLRYESYGSWCRLGAGEGGALGRYWSQVSPELLYVPSDLKADVLALFFHYAREGAPTEAGPPSFFQHPIKAVQLCVCMAGTPSFSVPNLKPIKAVPLCVCMADPPIAKSCLLSWRWPPTAVYPLPQLAVAYFQVSYCTADGAGLHCWYLQLS